MKCPYCGKEGCEKKREETTRLGVTFIEESWLCTNCEEEFEDGGMVNKNISNFIEAKGIKNDK